MSSEDLLPPILECEEAIQVGLQDVRISDLFGQVEEEERVQWISKASRNRHPETDLTVPPPEEKPASPATVSAELPVNDWIDSPELYNNDRRFRALADLGRRAGHRENELIMRQLAEDAQEFEFERDRLAVEDIDHVVRKIRSELHPDTLVVTPSQKMSLIKNGEIAGWENAKGHYCGLVRSLRTYWVNFPSPFENGVALVYARENAHLKRSRLRVLYNKQMGSVKIKLEYEVRAWFYDDEEAARISHRET
jgi:hypothetical protein